MNTSPIQITDPARFFCEPGPTRQRQYEALRAFYAEGLPSAEAARRYGYSPGSFRILCLRFRRGEIGDFFRDVPHGPKTQPKKDRVRDLVVALRKQSLSVYDIHRQLRERGEELSVTAITEVLRDEGFGRLPRRRDEERPRAPRPERAAVADARNFSLAPRSFESQFGALFLFLPMLARLDLAGIAERCGLPGSKMIPAAHALRSMLALKLAGTDRKSHVMDLVFDEGLALFSGLNCTPKATYLAQYSSSIDHHKVLDLTRAWLRALEGEKLLGGTSFDLDFHPIPFFGEDEFIERHYLSKRSRRQESVLCFLANDAESRVFCYSNADLRKGEEKDEILRFVEFWEGLHGAVPAHLAFDSTLTTHGNLRKLAEKGIVFLTLRRRDASVVREIANQPRGAWRKVTLDVPHRKYRTPKVIDQRVVLRRYHPTALLRQILVKDLGHEKPTVILTNDFHSTPKALITRYARRMLIENGLADAVDFFHLDSLSSAVALKVDFDVLLTVMASALYRLLARRLKGYERATAAQLFRRFLHAPAQVEVGPERVLVTLPKRAHNPILVASGLLDQRTPIPWWGGRTLEIRVR